MVSLSFLGFSDRFSLTMMSDPQSPTRTSLILLASLTHLPVKRTRKMRNRRKRFIASFAQLIDSFADSPSCSQKTTKRKKKEESEDDDEEFEEKPKAKKKVRSNFPALSPSRFADSVSVN